MGHREDRATDLVLAEKEDRGDRIRSGSWRSENPAVLYYFWTCVLCCLRTVALLLLHNKKIKEGDRKGGELSKVLLVICHHPPNLSDTPLLPYYSTSASSDMHHLSLNNNQMETNLQEHNTKERPHILLHIVRLL